MQNLKTKNSFGLLFFFQQLGLWEKKKKKQGKEISYRPKKAFENDSKSTIVH